MDTTAQQFLSAAIKLSRPPKDCVVFESNPFGIAAAHNCSCKARQIPLLVVLVQTCLAICSYSLTIFGGL